MNVEAALLDEKETATAHPARILVVEDERIVARSLRRQLAALGYEVVGSVASGEEAVRQAGVLRPDLVLMDISLEGVMDGVAAAAAIRKRLHLPVVYLTAYSNKEVLERAKVTEPFGYILKPYEDRELQVVIETGLYKHGMERRQQERDQWFVATLKSIGDAVIATDEEGRITYMNPPAKHLTGWASKDALGRTFDEVAPLIQEESRQPAQSPMDQAMEHGAPSNGVLLVARDHSERAVESCVSLITDEQGDALGKVVVLRDVTWRRRLEEQLREARKMEAISRLAGGVAHSFNNLMAVVLGYSEIMLARLKPSDPAFEMAEEIKRSALRTASLTRQLLAFGRKQLMVLHPIDVNVAVGKLVEVLRRMQEGVRVDLSLQPELGSTRADPDQVEQVIFTMVRKACAAMPGGGQINIQTANIELGRDYTQDHPGVAAGPYVLLAISHTGVGMDKETISHLFEPFCTEPAGVGDGLDLAAVYGFVKQCGGDIDVRSQPRKGTAFHIYFPRVEGAAGAEETDNAPCFHSPGS